MPSLFTSPLQHSLLELGIIEPIPLLTTAYARNTLRDQMARWLTANLLFSFSDCERLFHLRSSLRVKRFFRAFSNCPTSCDRVQAKYGMPCSRALSQPVHRRQTAVPAADPSATGQLQQLEAKANQYRRSDQVHFLQFIEGSA